FSGSEPGNDEMTDEPTDDGSEVVDLTGASDEEVLKTIELMEPTDQIAIIQTDNGIQIDFEPKEDESEESEDGNIEISADPENSDNDIEITEVEDDKVVFEIKLDE